MIFVAPYIDESGTHEDASMLVLAGYLATLEKWATFTGEWNKILDDLQRWQSIKKDHYYFHMQKFAGNWGPYEKFARYPDDKAEFAQRIFSLINATKEMGFAASMPMKEYNAAVEPAFRAQVGHAYTCLAQLCLGWVGEWADFQEAHGEAIAPIMYTFESGAAHEDEADEILKVIRHSPIDCTRHHYHDHVFVDKRKQPALQAADVLACETFRDLERNLTGVIGRGDYYLTQLVDHRDNILTLNREQIRSFFAANLERWTDPNAR